MDGEINDVPACSPVQGYVCQDPHGMSFCLSQSRTSKTVTELLVSLCKFLFIIAFTNSICAIFAKSGNPAASQQKQAAFSNVNEASPTQGLKVGAEVSTEWPL